MTKEQMTILKKKLYDFTKSDTSLDYPTYRMYINFLVGDVNTEPIAMKTKNMVKSLLKQKYNQFKQEIEDEEKKTVKNRRKSKIEVEEIEKEDVDE